MIEESAATGGRNSHKEARKNKEIIETKLSESFEKRQPTDEFRQTLLKSGLDVSPFQAEKSKPAQDSDDKSLKTNTVDSTKSGNDFLEAGLIQRPDKLAAGDKENPARFNRWRHLPVIAGILAIIVLQSAFQFFFVQDENQRVAENVIKNDLPVGKIAEKSSNDSRISDLSIPEVKPETKIEMKNAHKKSAAKTSIAVKSEDSRFRRESKISTPRTASRKKDGRESSTERLRRAEKILTGI